MTLAFSTHINGQPTYFPEKIWSGLKFDDPREWSILHSCYLREYKLKIGEEWSNEYKNIARAYPPKLHTIRADTKNRWKPGNKIHPIINNRTKDRFQFAPTLVCKSVQEIEIKWFNEWDETPLGRQVLIFIDGELFTDIERLAFNDGFDSVEAFYQWFKEDFKGKIIHWTDLKY